MCANKITGKKRLLDFAGILSKESADRIEKHIKIRRAIFDKEAKKRRRELLKDFM